MPHADAEALRSIRTFPSLVKYLRDELEWPIEANSFDEIMFDYEPEELGLDPKTAAKVRDIRQLRPLVTGQPWGVFFVSFEPKRLPIVVLRKILGHLVVKQRQSAKKAHQPTWQLNDLLFISSYGESEHRDITFAHFADEGHGRQLPALKVLGWDDQDTLHHLDHAHLTLVEKLRWPEDPAAVDAWRQRWSSAFELGYRQAITTAKELAQQLARLATVVRRRVNLILAHETERGGMRKLMKAFREALIHDLTEDDFADTYAQTIAYGLLTEKLTAPEGGKKEIRIANPFLAEILDQCRKVGRRHGLMDFDELGVGEIEELLNSPQTKFDAIRRDFNDKNPQEDPVIHFYELFLKEYDPKKRTQRGVFYTPRPVVSYIVRSVDEILKKEFGLKDGLADTTTWGEMAKRQQSPRSAKRGEGQGEGASGFNIPEGTNPNSPFVTILDPACGTGTFLVEVIDQVHRNMEDRWKREKHLPLEYPKLWNDYVPKHLLPRLFGFELMMAPYAIAHMKLGLKLAETGYHFGADEHARIYVTNSLEPPHDIAAEFAVTSPALAHEARAVNEIKRDQRFTVVIGNPPYSKMSGNLGQSAVSLIEPFRSVDGVRLVEKGALALELNLQDDYVKFWGFVAATLERSSVGVAGFVSNSRYLASPTLRGMRNHFSRAYAGGFFLDLGGQVSERKSVEGVDENVFEIEQGVCVGLIVRDNRRPPMGSVRYGRLLGSRTEKHDALRESSCRTLPTSVEVTSPLFRFSKAVDAAEQEYSSWMPLDQLMPFNSGAIITSRDNLALDFQKKDLLGKVRKFGHSARGDKSVFEEIGFIAKAKWDVEACKASIRAVKSLDEHVQTVLYRPFDQRYIYYSSSLLDTPSRPVCEALFGQENLVLLTPRVKTTNEFTHVLVARMPAEKKACSHDRATQMFPLYRTMTNLSVGGIFSSNLIRSLAPEIHGRKSAEWPELSLKYLYAILHSPAYRDRYGSALRDDFPRIPLPGSLKLFHELAALGGELVSLHLMEFDVGTSPSPRPSPLPGRGMQIRIPSPSEGEGRGEGGWHGIDDGHSCSPAAGRKVYKPQSHFTGKGGNAVAKGYPKYENETVWINPAQGFKGVPANVWEFHVGGYQVCSKWLKDRRGRTLTPEDVEHYQRVVVALRETIRLMAEIDKVIDAHGSWPGAFATAAPAETSGKTDGASLAAEPKEGYIGTKEE